MEFAQRRANRIPWHAAGPLHAIAKERATAEGACIIHGTAALRVEQRASSLVHERQRATILCRHGVAPPERAERLCDERPLDVRDPGLAPGAFEMTAVRARVAAKAVERPVKPRVRVAQAIEKRVTMVVAAWRSALHAALEAQRATPCKGHPI